MKLTDYLKQLKECPDERLRDELGVYDNWPIFLNTEFDFALNYLKNSGKYNYLGGGITNPGDEKLIELEKNGKPKFSFIDKEIEKHFFDYIPGIVTLQTTNRVPFYCCDGTNEDIWTQKNNYKMMIMLHPYQDMKTRKRNAVIESRALADVISDIGNFIIKEKIPASMPNSVGWKNRQDYSKIVYHLKNKIK